MYCTNCGFELEDDSRFCAHCGAKVEKPEEELTSDVSGTDGKDASSDGADGADEATGQQDAAADATTVLPAADATTVLPDDADGLPRPPMPDEPAVDMTHAFDPQPAPAATMQMPVVDAAPASPRRYDGIPPEEIVGKPAKPKKKLGTGAIVGIVIGAVAIVAIIAVVLFLFAFRGTAHTVSFETAGGSTIEAEQVDEGESLNSPADPVRDGYSFGGWYADAGFTTPVTFPLTPDADMTLYAKWVPLEGSTSSGAGATSETYSTNDQARAALSAYVDSLEQANEVVHDFATDSFNKKFNKGQSKVLDCMDDCNEARQKVYELLASGTGAQWKVSTMTLPATFSEQRSMLEQASDMLVTRLNAYSSALQVINNMGMSASSKEIETAIKSYLDDGHVAYESYKDLVAKVKKNL